MTAGATMPLPDPGLSPVISLVVLGRRRLTPRPARAPGGGDDQGGPVRPAGDRPVDAVRQQLGLAVVAPAAQHHQIGVHLARHTWPA